MSEYLLAFESTHAALATQRAFERAGVVFSLIPTPRIITAGCGMTLRFEAEDHHAALLIAKVHSAPASSMLYAWDGVSLEAL